MGGAAQAAQLAPVSQSSRTTAQISPTKSSKDRSSALHSGFDVTGKGVGCTAGDDTAQDDDGLPRPRNVYETRYVHEMANPAPTPWPCLEIRIRARLTRLDIRVTWWLWWSWTSPTTPACYSIRIHWMTIGDKLRGNKIGFVAIKTQRQTRLLLQGYSAGFGKVPIGCLSRLDCIGLVFTYHLWL